MSTLFSTRSTPQRLSSDPLWLRYGPVVVAIWIVLLVCAAARGQSSILWTRPSPSARTGQAMAYDSARHVVVMFGGSTLNDTWEWDGTTWNRVYVGGPSARKNHSMAYDSLRGVTVLYGGDGTLSGKFSDTWEWNGATWRQVASTGPGARSRTPMVYDSLRGVMVIFSGEVEFGNRPADTWEWNGTVWTQRLPALSPAGTHSHGLSYDSARNVVVLTGGIWNSTNGTSGTWEWNGATWTRRGESQSDFGYPMAFDSVRNISIRNGNKWNGSTWLPLAGPAPRPDTGLWGGSMAFDSGRGVFVLAASAADGSFRTWEWNGAGWSDRSLVAPSARRDHAMAFDSGRGVAVMFGGQSSPSISPSSLPFGDTWEWNGATWVQRAAGGQGAPPNAFGNAMTYDRARGVSMMFGGRDAEGVGMDQTWEWNGSVWTNRGVPGPPARSWPGMAYDSARGVTVLFGGRTDLETALSDTWEWNGTAWTLRASIGPEARSEHVMAFDSRRNVIVLHGGITYFGTTTRFSDTWEWNGAAWSQRATTGPSARSGSAMAFDSPRGVCVLNGGRAGSDRGDTWEWDGVQWTQVGTTTSTLTPIAADPGAHSGAAMVYDELRHEMFMFGGTPGATANNTWLYRTDCIAPTFVPASTQTQRACRGSTVTLNVSAMGSDVGYLWFKGAAGLGTGPTGTGSMVSGSNTTTLTISNVGSADTNTYFLRAGNACGIANSAALVVRVCVADFNCSGTVTVDDVFDYLNAWLGGDAYADIDGGGLSVQDIFAFINVWFGARTSGGCS